MLSIFVIPVSIAEEIEKKMKDFLWGSTMEKQKFHLISWEQICISLDCGGLGLKKIKDINTALLCKWIWNIGDGDTKLCKRVIFDKYGE